MFGSISAMIGPPRAESSPHNTSRYLKTDCTNGNYYWVHFTNTAQSTWESNTLTQTLWSLLSGICWIRAVLRRPQHYVSLIFCHHTQKKNNCSYNEHFSFRLKFKASRNSSFSILCPTLFIKVQHWIRLRNKHYTS